MNNPTYELDARNINCPLPLLRTKKKLATMNKGESVRIYATDPNAMQDFSEFASQTGHQLLEANEINGEFHFLLQKNL